MEEEGNHTNVVTQDDSTGSCNDTFSTRSSMTPLALLTRQGDERDEQKDQDDPHSPNNILRLRYQAAVKLLHPSPFTNKQAFIPNVSCSVWEQLQQHRRRAATGTGTGSSSTSSTTRTALVGNDDPPSSSSYKNADDGSTGFETLNALIRDPYTGTVWPLRTGTVVSLVGPPSSGKTQLALQWAVSCSGSQQQPEQQPHQPHDPNSSNVVQYWTNDTVLALQRRCRPGAAIQFRSLATTTDLACALAEWEESQQQELQQLRQQQHPSARSTRTSMIVIDALDGLEALGAMDVFSRFQQWFLRLASWYPVRILVVLGSSSFTSSSGQPSAVRFGTIQLELSKTTTTTTTTTTPESTTTTTNLQQPTTSTVRVQLVHHETRVIDPSVPSISLTLSSSLSSTNPPFGTTRMLFQ